jgi:hypothetical protein
LCLVKNGNGGAALEIVQRLRAHYGIETTNIYLQIPDEELDKLTLQLFERDYFGYIPSLLLNVMAGQDDIKVENTQEIINIKTRFNGIYGIEATAGFINQVQAERQTVADMIIEMGVEKASETLFKLDLGLLPSRQENIQCLVADLGCVKPTLKNCMRCPYSISNFYAITSLTHSITKLLKTFKEEFESTDLDAEKTKLVNLLFIEMEQFEEAINVFGEKEVFSFFEGGKSEYDNLLDILDIVEEKNGDLEAYKTLELTKPE